MSAGTSASPGGQLVRQGRVLSGSLWGNSLVEGGHETGLRETDDPGTALTALVRGHIDFTLMERELCVVYVGELRSLPRTDRHRLRWKQRHYVDLWIDLLRMARPELTPEQAQVRVHATISSIHSVLLYHSPLDQPGLTDEMVMVSGDVLGLPRTSPVTSG